MKHLKQFESYFSDNVRNAFKNDVYYMDKDDYNYPDGFSRYFKRGDTVVLFQNPGFMYFKIGDKLRILRMEGQNAKVINLRNAKIEVLSLADLLSEEDYELSQSINKYNL
jgi:hypothetical protein